MSAEPPVPPVPPVPPPPPLPPEPEPPPPLPPGPEGESFAAPAAEAPRLPGVPHRGFDRLPTAPVPAQSQSGPAEDGSGEAALPSWMPAPEPARAQRGYAGWALGVAIVGLLFSLFVGWGLPLGLVAIVTAILALRRPWESRAVAVWALVLGGVSVA
jgi:hypothetical protein